MSLPRFALVVVTLLSIFSVVGAGLAQAQTPGQSQPQPSTQAHKVACGPDHVILYKRAVKLLDEAEKKLNAKYTAEAKALVKDANHLFTTLQKECGQEQRERLLTPREEQQEAINKKLAADALAQADRLMEAAAANEKKSQEFENKGQNELSVKHQRQAKGEYDLAHTLSIKAGIYALRNQQMVFQWLGK
jgi:hypothetical protein